MSAVTVSLTRIEIAHLGELAGQLADLVEGAPAAVTLDPALERLAPDVYPDDPEASRDFRAVTRADLLSRRACDARLLREDLPRDVLETDSDQDPHAPVEIRLGPEHIEAWMRTLAALRLVVATRLGIEGEDDHDPEDPRFGIYDWLGYRLEMLIEAADAA